MRGYMLSLYIAFWGSSPGVFPGTEMAGRCLMKAQSQQVKETYTNVFFDDFVSVAVSFPYTCSLLLFHVLPLSFLINRFGCCCFQQTVRWQAISGRRRS